MANLNFGRCVAVLVVLALPFSVQGGLVSVSGNGASCLAQILTGNSVTVSMPGGPQLPDIGSGPFTGAGSLSFGGVAVSGSTTLEIASLEINGLVSTSYGDRNLANNVTGTGRSLIDFTFELDVAHDFALSSAAASLAPYLGSVVFTLDGIDMAPTLGGSVSHIGQLAAGFHTIYASSLTPNILGATLPVLTTLDFQLKLEPTAVPEPASWLLMAIAGVAGAFRVARSQQWITTACSRGSR